MVAMDTNLLKSTLLSLVLTLIVTLATAAFNDHSEKILLSDVKVLTLHHGQMTNARRSPAVPQLKRVGGSAHYKFTPKVVQCTNKGSDGYDIQWECKTDMDNAYRFGPVEVTCEGYDYPNDPYVLKGSCGLEYTLEFTEEGLQREQQKGGYSYHNSYKYEGSSGGVNGLIFIAVIILVMYFIYKVCIAPNDYTAEGYGRQQPPPYGFRPEYMPGQGPPPPTYDSCGAHGYANTGFASAPPGNAGGFWTGAASGGLLGYLLGRSNNYNYGPTYHRPANPWGFGQNYASGSGPSSSSFFSSSSGAGSSGTRTASGFGGTSRR
ncbi:hypothetical protein BsWGS_19842 [Bradybaena similaris]